MRRSLAVGLLVASIGLGSSAGAYEQSTTESTGIPLKWTALPMKFNIHERAAPGVTASATYAAIRAAYRSWTEVLCADFTVKDLGVVDLPAGDDRDYVNTHIVRTAWPADLADNALGITFMYYIPTTGRIVDADVHYNPSYPWSTTGERGAVDIQSVATHEIGHQLGLGHTPVEDATMYFEARSGSTTMRSLHDDDIEGLCHIYPATDSPAPQCSSKADCGKDERCSQDGRCVPDDGRSGFGFLGCGGDSGSLMLPVVALPILLLGRRRRRASS